MNTLTKHLQSLNIVRPVLILDKDKVKRNIEKMHKKAEASGVRFRPHFKTHQSAAIGNWFRDAGIESITVSSLDMARYFASNGWTDITVAFPVNITEIQKINELAQKINLGLLVDSEYSLQFLDSSLSHNVQMWIEMDAGYHRSGVSWGDFDLILSLAQKIDNSSRMKFAGLLTHSGHSYYAKSTDEIKSIYSETFSRLSKVKKELEQKGISDCAISIGDTPGCSIVESFEGVDEIRPGNFVFYDLMQSNIGSCTEEEIAVVVACPVVSKNKERKQVVVYGGAVHFSKEYITDVSNRKIYGYVTLFYNSKWGKAEKSAPLISLSQEHGIIQVEDDKLFEEIEIGDFLLVFPVHSCLTGNLYEEYRTLEGETISRIQSNKILIV